MIENAGFEVSGYELATNVPFLHKYKMFRKQTPGGFDEGRARSQGFELNSFGAGFYNLLRGIFPASFGSTLVFFAIKPN